MVFQTLTILCWEGRNDDGTEHINYLIHRIDDLLENLEVDNPIYRSALSIADNPVINLIAASIQMNPFWFAEALNESSFVCFDIGKIHRIMGNWLTKRII